MSEEQRRQQGNTINTGFHSRPPIGRDRYHREVDELDYIVPKKFHEHDDRDVWRPRGRAQAVQHAPQHGGNSQRGYGSDHARRDHYHRGYGPDVAHRHSHPRHTEAPRWQGRADRSRGPRPRSRERSPIADRSGRGEHVDSGEPARKMSARELARQDFERSRGLPSSKNSSEHGEPERGGAGGDSEQIGKPKPDFGWQPKQQRWKRGPADEAKKWGHDKFEEIKDAPVVKKDPLELLLPRRL